MTTQDSLLVAVLALLAVAVTVADLVYCWRDRRRRATLARAPRPTAATAGLEGADTSVKRQAIRRRLAAIQSGSGDPTEGDPPSEQRVLLHPE